MRYLSEKPILNTPNLDIQDWAPAQWLRAKWRTMRAMVLKVKRLGVWRGMPLQDRSKLTLFNFLNFFQLCSGLLLPLLAFATTSKVPMAAWIFAFLPPLVSAVVLVLNARRMYNEALLVYFICYPFCTCLAYINGIDLGIELSFVLYGILSVFFIQDRSYMVFSIGFSMISYFVLAVMLQRYPFQLSNVNTVAYLINQAIAILYIFYGLYLIKLENARFNSTLQQAHDELQKQALQLQLQADELEKLNSLKSKLFSVISHDLKAPMYALRNLFENIHLQDLPAEEVKEMVPEIKKDLNDTVGLMENLLQWAKSQMQAESASINEVDVNELVHDVANILHRQAGSKQVEISIQLPHSVFAMADFDMIHLVMRNLLSNAIKFTEPRGKVLIGAQPLGTHAELYVKDYGQGIEPEALEKIEAGEFYTSTGTSQEQGTGLGLLLCKEFLVKNSSQLRIETTPGEGSTFSFLLPLAGKR